MTASEIAARLTVTRAEVDEALEGLVRKGFAQVIRTDAAGNSDYAYTAKARNLKWRLRRRRAVRVVRELGVAFCDLAVDPVWSWWMLAALGGGLVLAGMLVVNHVTGIVP